MIQTISYKETYAGNELISYFSSCIYANTHERIHINIVRLEVSLVS